jgi:hypothetical protein
LLQLYQPHLGAQYSGVGLKHGELTLELWLEPAKAEAMDLEGGEHPLAAKHEEANPEQPVSKGYCPEGQGCPAFVTMT